MISVSWSVDCCFRFQIQDMMCYPTGGYCWCHYNGPEPDRIRRNLLLVRVLTETENIGKRWGWCELKFSAEFFAMTRHFSSDFEGSKYAYIPRHHKTTKRTLWKLRWCGVERTKERNVMHNKQRKAEVCKVMAYNLFDEKRTIRRMGDRP